ncbi:MAG: hypothetical protein VYC68_04710, partial [Candidatus Thermoplasmatota archaeon]|nr:hypothetical protein [Candidatus Thermoplasmatota archaeon]
TQSNQDARMAKSVHTPQKLRTARQAKSVHTPQKKLRTPRPTPEKQSAGGGQDLAARREALLATAKAELKSIVSMFDVPITRPQWAAWLDDNIGEFHERMKTAPQRRSALNTRLRARRDLPEPLKRLHPRSGAKAECSTQWAKNLAGRSGWHGLETNTKRMMMMLMCNGGVTYYIDLEPNRVEPGVLSYALTCDFDLETSLALQTRTPSLNRRPKRMRLFDIVPGNTSIGSHGAGLGCSSPADVVARAVDSMIGKGSLRKLPSSSSGT